MQIIIDSTITKEEELELKSGFICPILRFDENIHDFFPQELYDGSRFDTIFLSKNPTNYLIHDSNQDIWIYPTLVQIDTYVWNMQTDTQVSGKSRNITEFIKGDIYTLFSEKYAYTNDYNASCKNTTFMFSPMNIKVNTINSFLIESKTVNVYSLGRYFGRANRADNIDFLSSKIELKYAEKEIHQKNLSGFICNGYNFFRKQVPDAQYDYVCNVPVKKDKFNRFNKIKTDDILCLLIDYPDLKKYNFSERKALVSGVFGLNNGIDVLGKSILIIDDVYTTGATTSEIAGMLYEHGASRVDVFSIANTCHNNYTGFSIICGKCNSPITIRYTLKNSNPVMYCQNESCAQLIKLPQPIFAIFDFIYGIKHLNSSIEKSNED